MNENHPEYILHNYFRSTTSLRVRIALGLKNLDYDYVSYALLEQAHKDKAYLKLNPQGLVPALEIKEGEKTIAVLTQSLAIIAYLEEHHPCPALLPPDPIGRARVRALSHIIALDIHPLGNLRVLQYLEQHFGADQPAKQAWFKNWAAEGMAAFEARLNEKETGQFCHGDTPGLADICLYAQMFNNQRFGLDMHPYPEINRIFQECDKLAEFRNAAPDAQPDAG